MDNQSKPSESDTETTNAKSEAPIGSAGEAEPMASILYLSLYAMVILAISYGLTFVWPSDDKSLHYLPRFLTSCVLAYLLIDKIGAKLKS